jgi:hypothetical protein
MALAATYLHAHGAGQVAGASNVTADVTGAVERAAIHAAEGAVSDIVHAAVQALASATVARLDTADSRQPVDIAVIRLEL